MESLPRIANQATLNSQELSNDKENSCLDNNSNAETQQATATASIAFNSFFAYPSDPMQPISHSHQNDPPHNSNIANLMNIPERSPELEPVKTKPKRRTCYHCGEAGHTTMNCTQTEVNHNLPKRSSGKKLTPEEIQLVIHCYFKCEEERLTHKAVIKADSVRRTAFYLGMSKNTVARLVREYAQTGELPISKVRPESGKAQPSVPTSNRKKLKWKEARAQKPASTTVASSSSADRNPHFPLEHSLSHSHSPSLSPPSIITRASSISIPSMASLLPVPARPENPSLVNVSAPTLMGIHEMLINPSSSLFESDAALSNIINPVYDDDTMLSSSKHVPDTNPRL